MTAGRLILLRHGETDWNAKRLFQGQADIPLNDTGRAQAAAVAPLLAALEPTALYSSDLQRPRQTIAPLAELTGLEVRLDERFREIAVGSWEGLGIEDISEQVPDYSARLAAGEAVRRSPTGEDDEEVAVRVAAGLDDIASRHDETETVVIASHGVAIRVGAARLLGWDLVQARGLAGMGNARWAGLTHHGDHWRLAEYNAGVR